MAFRKKQENSTAPAPSAPKAVRAPAKKKVVKGEHVARPLLTKAPGRILLAPRITEKAVKMTVGRVYVFEVAPDATKRDVVIAVQEVYHVVPQKVHMVCKQPRAYVARMRNRQGTKAGLKKAYVFLKEGDKIDRT